MIPLEDSYYYFNELLKIANEKLGGGDLSGAAGLAQIAVRHAFPGKGLFVSPRLEHLLLEIGRKIPTDVDSIGLKCGSHFRNVLHILTHARPIGGDSRFVWRWIQRDRDSRHSIAITAQSVIGLFDIPRELIEAVEQSGGFLQILRAPTCKPLEKARELRMLCRDMDIVVLHLFPYDIIPSLALAAGCESVKTIFINHSDHTFWIGAGVAHWIAHLRNQSPAFVKSRRGLDPNRASILPIPLASAPLTITRSEARRSLGYGPESVILLTIASPFKYSAPSQIAFLDLVTPVLTKNPEAILIAVGPEAKNGWRSANRETKGRIIPLGVQWENELLYAAADVYLDSVPFSSITSLLEAGAHGLPLLGYRLPEPDLLLLGPGAPGLEKGMEVAMDAESYRRMLTRLIKNEGARRRNGQLVQEGIHSFHAGKNWVQALSLLYERVESSDNRKCLLEKQDIFEKSPLNLALVRLYSQSSYSARRLIRESLRSLPYFSRLSITWRLYGIGFDFCFLNLFPPPADGWIQRAGSWIKQVLRGVMKR